MVAIEQPTKPKQRGQLSRELILDATRNLLDEHGLEALSMRAVANAVGSSPMALYRYVSDRRDLEIAVAQLVSVELELIDDPTVAPDEAIATWMRKVRAHWLRHPWIGPLLGEHPELAEFIVAVGTALAGALERAGASARIIGEEVIHITRTTLGVVLLEQSAPLARRADSLAWRSGEGSGSAIARAAGAIDDDQLFELVIHSTIAGLEARLAVSAPYQGGMYVHH